MAKKKTQVALAPAIGYPLIGAAGYLTSKAVEKFMDKKGDDDEVEQLKKMIDEETKKAKKKGLKGGIETDAVRLKAAKKGGLIKSKKKAVKKFRGDGIVKKGKTKCKMR